MKLAMAHMLLFLLLVPVSAAFAQSTSQTLALSWFHTPDGSTGIVSVIRQPDPTTGLPTPSLYYSFCVETEDATCQEGQGIIPDGDFVGNVSTKLTAKDTLTLLADTTIPGFTNWLCITPNYNTASCDGGTAPAIGGIIQVSWAKNNTWARITLANDKLYNLGSLNEGTASGIYGFSARMQGIVLGVPANTVGITTGEMYLETGSTTTGGSTIQTLAQRFAKGRKAK